MSRFRWTASAHRSPCLVPLLGVVPILLACSCLFAAAVPQPPRIARARLLDGLGPITWSKHVAPILFKNCASCHRPGEIGPFPLLTYRDAAKRAKFLKEVTTSRRMPPWKPVPGHGEFQDARRLSAEEINTLAQWADTGAKQGEAKDAPPVPKFTEGWQLGKPDLVLKVSEPFTIRAGGNDVWRCFVIPTGLKENRTVAAVEFRPGNRRIVHHTLIAFDTTGEARKLDEADPGPGFRSSGAGIGVRPSGMLGAWVPGSTARRWPKGVGRPLPRGADVVIQIHYKPSGKEEKDQSTLGIFFADKPARQPLCRVRLAEPRLRIPVGEKRHRVAQRYTLPVDVHAFGILPHMHLLGREMKVTATLPNGKKQPMIWISDWDFNWQGEYRYAQPVALPKGTILEMEAFFDNSAKNPANPNNPPKTVWYGGRTVDEMCECNLRVIVDGSPSDVVRLRKDQAQTTRERRRLFQQWFSEQDEIREWRQWLLEQNN